MSISRKLNESDADYIKRLETYIKIAVKDNDPNNIKPDKDADYTDDWMNPSIETHKYKGRENKTTYIIERQRAVPVTGNVAYITEWHVWAIYDSKEERDEEYINIKRKHPSWVIKKGTRNPFLDRVTARLTA